jgi:hypothetical protein
MTSNPNIKVHRVHKKFGQKVEAEFASERARLSAPLTPFLCKVKENNEIKGLL